MGRAARAVAADEGVHLTTKIADLERDPLPDGPYELVACVDYRQPSLFPEMIARLAPGGVLLAQLATVTNLERHDKPSRRFLAEPRELRKAAGDLGVLLYGEGWHDDRHVARLVARFETPKRLSGPSDGPASGAPGARQSWRLASSTTRSAVMPSFS